MLLDFLGLIKKYKISPKGVIVAGAHTGEEYSLYLQAGIQHFVFVEPCKKAFDELNRQFQFQPNVKLFNMALGNKCELDVKMYTSDNASNKGQSNSILKPSLHLSLHKEIEFDGEENVCMDRLDSLNLMPEGTGAPHPSRFYDLLVMDCQGYEGEVLKGAKRTLLHIDFVYTEVNRMEVYERNTMVDEVDELLGDFVRVETSRWIGGAWADAFFIRKTLLK